MKADCNDLSDAEALFSDGQERWAQSLLRFSLRISKLQQHFE